MNGRWYPKFKMAPEGDGGGNGGGAAGNLLGGDGGGSQAQAGNQNPGSSSGQGSKTTDDSGGNSGSGGAAATDWKSQLPPELQENSQIGRFNSVADLASGYANLQRQFSSEKLIVPGKNATDADWNLVYEKLGLPKDVKDYAVKFKEGVTIDEEFATDFRTQAHKHGILPKQAQALADWFADKNSSAEEALKAEMEKNFTAELGALKKEWGDGFQKKLGMANVLFGELSPEVQQAFKDSGLARNTHVLRAFAAFAETYKGESAVINPGDGKGNKGNTPAEAKAQIDKIMGDTTHPYFQKDHPGHKGAVEEVKKLYAALHPST